MDKSVITCKIEFSNPLSITPTGSSGKDMLIIKIANKTESDGKTSIEKYFSSVENGLSIQSDNLLLAFPIPGQIPANQQ